MSLRPSRSRPGISRPGRGRQPSARIRSRCARPCPDRPDAATVAGLLTKREAGHAQGRRGRSQGGCAPVSQRAPAGKARGRRHQAARQPARPCSRLFARRRLSLPGDRGRSPRCGDLYRAAESRRSAHQRHRRSRSRRHRPARRQAGDGGQGGPVQEIRRHRRVRHRGGGEERRQAGRRHRRARADLRRHQPRGHQGPRVLRGRGEGEGPDGHSCIPRRSARHGDHRFRRDRQRARTHRQKDRRGQDRLLGRGRGGARLAQSPRLARREAREHHRLRHRRRRLQGPREADGPLESDLCARDQRPHARGRDRRRGHIPWTVGRWRSEARDAQAYGERPVGDGARQSNAGNHAGIGARRLGPTQ